MEQYIAIASTKGLSKPWTADGRTFTDRCRDGRAIAVSTIQKLLTQACLRDDSLQKTTNALSKEPCVERYRAVRLVHTETTCFNAVAMKETYREMGVKRVEIVETLDGHTCKICQPLDGRIIPLSQYEPGVTVPPFHPNCRGTTAPAVSDRLLELDREINGGRKRIARDSDDGKTCHVPADMTYEV